MIFYIFSALNHIKHESHKSEPNPVWEEVVVPDGQTRQLSLSDGTSVILFKADGYAVGTVFYNKFTSDDIETGYLKR